MGGGVASCSFLTIELNSPVCSQHTWLRALQNKQGQTSPLFQSKFNLNTSLWTAATSKPLTDELNDFIIATMSNVQVVNHRSLYYCRCSLVRKTHPNIVKHPTFQNMHSYSSTRWNPGFPALFSVRTSPDNMWALCLSSQNSFITRQLLPCITVNLFIPPGKIQRHCLTMTLIKLIEPGHTFDNALH